MKSLLSQIIQPISKKSCMRYDNPLIEFNESNIFWTKNQDFSTEVILKRKNQNQTFFFAEQSQAAEFSPEDKLTK